MKYDAIVISGATGAVGYSLLAECLGKFNIPAYCICRSEAASSELLETIPGKFAHLLRFVYLDLAEESDVSGILDTQLSRDSINHCLALHCAADVSWTKSVEELRKLNVEGTRTFLKLLEGCSKRSDLVYLSTAFADFIDGNHRNGYEKTKADAEALITGFHASNRRVFIVRASLVIGGAEDGFIHRFNGIYSIIRLAATGDVPCLIAEDSYSIDVIPIDWLVQEVTHLLEKPDEIATVTAAAGFDSCLPLNELLDRTQQLANQRRRQKGLPDNPEVSVIGRRQYEFLMKSADSWGLDRYFRRTKQITRIMEGYIEHSESQRAIKPEGTLTDPPHWELYIDRVIEYWIEQNSPKVCRTAKPSWLRWQQDAAKALETGA